MENLHALPQLTSLNLSHNHVGPELDASTCGVPQLQELFLSHNLISSVRAPRSAVVATGAPSLGDECPHDVPSLRVLHLEDNTISELQQVAHLGHIFPGLQSLVLAGNPVCDAADYRAAVVRRIPSLLQLDHTRVTEAERSFVSLSFEREGALPSALSKAEACCGNVPVEARPITKLASESTAIAPVLSMPRASRMLFTCDSSPVKTASPFGSLYIGPPWRPVPCDGSQPFRSSSDARSPGAESSVSFWVLMIKQEASRDSCRANRAS